MSIADVDLGSTRRVLVGLLALALGAHLLMLGPQYLPASTSSRHVAAGHLEGAGHAVAALAPRDGHGRGATGHLAHRTMTACLAVLVGAYLVLRPRRLLIAVQAPSSAARSREPRSDRLFSQRSPPQSTSSSPVAASILLRL